MTDSQPATPRPGKLKGIKIDFVSLVPRGANQGSRVLLWKSADATPIQAMTDTTLAVGEATAPERPAPVASGEQMPDIKKARTAQEIMDSLPPEDKEALSAAIKAMCEQAAAAAQKQAPHSAADCKDPNCPEHAQEKVTKSLPAEVRKMLDDERTARVVLENQLANERDLRIEKEIRSDVEKWGSIPGVSTDDAVRLLKSARGKPAEETQLRALFSATSEILKTSALFKTLGVPGHGAAEGNAEGKVMAIAKELRAKDVTIRSDEAALARVADLHPSLYADWIAEDAARAN